MVEEMPNAFISVRLNLLIYSLQECGRLVPRVYRILLDTSWSRLNLIKLENLKMDETEISRYINGSKFDGNGQRLEFFIYFITVIFEASFLQGITV